VALSLVVVGVLDISVHSVNSFLPLNRSDSFLLESVDPDCEITTGAETGCCKPRNDACEDWDEKSPFARSQVFTTSRGRGNFPPSHPELYHVRHCRSWRKGSIDLKAAEEMFDSIEDLDYSFLASARFFSHLGARCQQSVCASDK
jgi:hypothetical protein